MLSSQENRDSSSKANSDSDLGWIKHRCTIDTFHNKKKEVKNFLKHEKPSILSIKKKVSQEVGASSSWPTEFKKYMMQ